MAAFPEYINSLGVGEDGGYMYPETFHDDLMGAYDSDIQGASAQISLLEAEIASLKAENVQLAAANWNLSQSIPTDTAVVDEPESEDDPSEDDDSDDADPSEFFK